MKKSGQICLAILPLLMAEPLAAQTMTLEDVIEVARTQSVQALQAKSAFVSDYWAWRSYQASRLPSLSLYGTVGSFNRYLNLLQDPKSGEMVYAQSNNLQNSLGLKATQNISFTGGTVSLYSDLKRIDQFGTNASQTWYAQPVTLYYNQPLFSYNQFKWDKLISPKEYEKARRQYLESMESVTLAAAQYFYNVMLAKKVYDASRTNYRNTSRMLAIARDRLSIGSVTRDEYLQLELRQLNDSISISENLVSLKKAQMQLNSLLGYNESHEIDPVLDENLPEVMMDYEFVLKKCQQNSSFELGNSIEMLNAESAIAYAKASRGITMQLSATFGLSNSSSTLAKTYGNMLDQEVVGLSFSIPIFDWGMGKGKVKKAEAAADVVRAKVEQAENDKRISIFTAVGQFNNQRQQCYASQRAYEISGERYELIMEKFSRGSSTVTELNTARSENDSAMQKYVSDMSNYWNYYYTLRQITLYDFIRGEDLTVSYDEMVK